MALVALVSSVAAAIAMAAPPPRTCRSRRTSRSRRTCCSRSTHAGEDGDTEAAGDSRFAADGSMVGWSRGEDWRRVGRVLIARLCVSQGQRVGGGWCWLIHKRTRAVAQRRSYTLTRILGALSSQELYLAKRIHRGQTHLVLDEGRRPRPNRRCQSAMSCQIWPLAAGTLPTRLRGAGAGAYSSGRARSSASTGR